MAERVYTVCRCEPEGAPAGSRTRVSQVSLRLKDDGRFELVKGDYYSDWGTRSQNSLTFSGTYSERDGAVECLCECVRDIDFSSDHDWGTRELKDTTTACGDRFTFKREDGNAVLCGVDYNGFLGRSMDTETVPANDQY